MSSRQFLRQRLLSDHFKGKRKSIHIAPFILRIVSKRSDHTVLPVNYTMPVFPS